MHRPGRAGTGTGETERRQQPGEGRQPGAVGGLVSAQPQRLALGIADDIEHATECQDSEFRGVRTVRGHRQHGHCR